MFSPVPREYLTVGCVVDLLLHIFCVLGIFWFPADWVCQCILCCGLPECFQHSWESLFLHSSSHFWALIGQIWSGAICTTFCIALKCAPGIWMKSLLSWSAGGYLACSEYGSGREDVQGTHRGLGCWGNLPSTDPQLVCQATAGEGGLVCTTCCLKTCLGVFLWTQGGIWPCLSLLLCLSSCWRC